MVLTPAELQQTITELRAKVAANRETYGQYRAALYPFWTEPWEAVAVAIIARVAYYRGEVLRAKHNLARYMRGEDAQEPRSYMDMWLPMLDDDLVKLHNSVVEVQNATGKLKQFNSWGHAVPLDNLDDSTIDFEDWRWSGLYYLAEMGLRLELDNLQDLKEIFERNTYAG